LEHGAILLLRIILVPAATKPIPEILVVFIIFVRGFVDNAAFLARLLIYAKGAWRSGWKARCAAVTDKVAFVKQLD
jgi:hypothetical protein